MSYQRIDWARFTINFLLGAVPVGSFVTMLILRYGPDVRGNIMVLVVTLSATLAGVLLGLIRLGFRGSE